LEPQCLHYGYMRRIGSRPYSWEAYSQYSAAWHVLSWSAVLGYDWFATIDLPNAYAFAFVVRCEYVAWHRHRCSRYVRKRCAFVDETLSDRGIITMCRSTVRYVPWLMLTLSPMNDSVCCTQIFFQLGNVSFYSINNLFVFDLTFHGLERGGGERGHCSALEVHLRCDKYIIFYYFYAKMQLAAWDVWGHSG